MSNQTAVDMLGHCFPAARLLAYSGMAHPYLLSWSPVWCRLLHPEEQQAVGVPDHVFGAQSTGLGKRGQSCHDIMAATP